MFGPIVFGRRAAGVGSPRAYRRSVSKTWASLRVVHASLGVTIRGILKVDNPSPRVNGFFYRAWATP